MLDVTLHDVDGITVTFAKSTHTAIIGPPASGISTLLRVIAGDARPSRGSVAIGARDVTRLKRDRRPLLYVTRDIDAPARWSVQHLLVAAVHQRSLDRTDRQHELNLAIEKWQLAPLRDRQLRTLSASERTRVNVARVELLKPAILVADGVVDRGSIAAEFYRTLRVLGTTVISAPASLDELGFTDRVVAIENGAIAQEGTFAQVYRAPASAAIARATGEANLIRVTVRAGEATSPIGSWRVQRHDGEAIAVIRPEDFAIAAKGEESDFIFCVEEATFHGDHWRATGLLTGNLALTIALPRDTELHKGRLLPVRYDPAGFALLPG